MGVVCTFRSATDLHSDMERESVSQPLAMYSRMSAWFAAAGDCAVAVTEASRKVAARVRFVVMVLGTRLEILRQLARRRFAPPGPVIRQNYFKLATQLEQG